MLVFYSQQMKRNVSLEEKINLPEVPLDMFQAVILLVTFISKINIFLAYIFTKSQRGADFVMTRS